MFKFNNNDFIEIDDTVTTTNISLSCIICGEATSNLSVNICEDCKRAIRRLKKEYKLLDEYAKKREKVIDNEDDI